MLTNKTYLALGSLLAAAALALPAASLAADQEGLVAVRDAQTGQLRPATPAELATLRQQAAAIQPALKTAPAPAVRRADGALQKDLGDSGMVYSVVTRDASGKLEHHCVQGEGAAEAATRNHQESSHETK